MPAEISHPTCTAHNRLYICWGYSEFCNTLGPNIAYPVARVNEEQGKPERFFHGKWLQNRILNTHSHSRCNYVITGLD